MAWIRGSAEACRTAKPYADSYDCATVDQAMDDMAYLMPDKRAVNGEKADIIHLPAIEGAVG